FRIDPLLFHPDGSSLDGRRLVPSFSHFPEDYISILQCSCSNIRINIRCESNCCDAFAPWGVACSLFSYWMAPFSLENNLDVGLYLRNVSLCNIFGRALSCRSSCRRVDRTSSLLASLSKAGWFKKIAIL